MRYGNTIQACFIGTPSAKQMQQQLQKCELLLQILGGRSFGVSWLVNSFADGCAELYGQRTYLSLPQLQLPCSSLALLELNNAQFFDMCL